MKRFTVTASYTMYCNAEIEAENIEEAKEIARNLDGGYFQPDTYKGDDWNIEDVHEIEEVKP